MKAAGRPGSPPQPPANLARRALPIATIAASTILFRIHATTRDALYFGRSSDPDLRQRWDDREAHFGVCYLATEDHIAFAETMLRDLDTDTLFEGDLAARSLALVRVIKPLRLVDVSGGGLRRLGADASVVTASYDTTQSWSAALHAHGDAADGIRYRARHDDSAYSVALFDCAAASIALVTSHSMVAPILADVLASWLERYRVRLIG